MIRRLLVALALGTAALAHARPLAATFTALDDDDATIPPDPSGAVGPAHLVAIAGTQLRIQSKTGAVLSTQPVGNLFTALGHTTHVPARVVYDALAGHWIVVATADGGTAVEVAVSTTTDPTGAYHAYSLPIVAATALNVRVGFNGALIAIAMDLVDVGTTTSRGVRIYACAKTALYTGTATCHANDRAPALGDRSPEPALTYDTDMDEILVERDTSGDVRLLQITGVVGSETISSVGFSLNVSPWAASGPQTNLGFAPQAGTLNRLDTGDDRITSAVVRHHHVFATQTIYLPQANPTRTAVQWFELDGYLPIQVGRIDDATGAFDYAYPTIAVNLHDDVMVTFAKLGASISPSAAYAARLHGDPLGQLSPDALVRAGGGTYAKTHGGTVNRWGGAGGAAVDPADDATLWAIAAVAAAPDPSPCTLDCGNWSTVWAALGTDCLGQANGVACDTNLCLDGPQVCSGGACTGGTPTTCTAPECYTTGACVSDSGCPAIVANDGTPCTEGVCQFGQCQHYADDFPFGGDPSDPSPDAPVHDPLVPGKTGGCCEIGGNPGGFVLAFGVALALRRRRR